MFVEEASVLVEAAKGLGSDLADTFGVNPKIAQLNEEQFNNWTPDGEGPAAWAYRGETFFGLSADLMDQDTLEFAQEHIYIASGLYGLLRPKDSISPYRLEMSTKLSGEWGKNLYEFWGEKLANQVMSSSPGFILNCASDEYFRAIKKYLPKDMVVVTPKFLHEGKSKMAFSKYTRGLMARWASENKISEPAQVLNFNAEGYILDSESDDNMNPVFNAPADFSLKGRWVKT